MKKRRIWHTVNKPFIFWYFQGICQECKSEIHSFEKYDIHHLHYKFPNLYYSYWLDLIEADVITLVHRKCHDRIHQGTEEEVLDKNNLKNSIKCEWCGNHERSIMARKINLKLDINLCRKCFLCWKNGGEKQLSLF